MRGLGTSPFYMRPANELVAEGFERERCDRRTRAFLAERIVALKAQVEKGLLTEEAAALTIRQLEAVIEMIAQGLHDLPEAAA